jgi:hypothetical protein
MILRVAAAALVAILARLLVQPLLPADENPLLPASAIVEAGLLPVAFLAYGFIVYVALGLVYHWYDPPGSGRKRGLAFAGLYLLMWIPLLLEPLPHAEGMSWQVILGYPLADGFGIVVLGAMLGTLLPEARTPPPPRSSKRDAAIRTTAVAVTYALVRTATAASLPLYTWFDDRPWLSSGWAVVTGLCFGLMYALSAPRLSARRLGASLGFALVLVGANLLLFNGFMLLVAKVDPIDLLARTGLDLLALAIGAWVAGRMAGRLDG